MDTKATTTADELLERGQRDGRFELVSGELRPMSPAGHWHGAVVPVVTALLLRHVQANGLGVVYGAETGFVLARGPDTVLAPDVAFVQRERALPAGPGYFQGPPDLAVEVVSPNDGWGEVQDKAIRYLDHGVALVWVLSPAERAVTVFASRGDVRVLRADDELTGGDVVPGFSARVFELFPELPGSSGSSSSSPSSPPSS